MLKDYFLIAFGSLRKRFLRTCLTMLGIFIGIAAVVSLVSLGQGMQNAINAQFASVGKDKIIIEGASAEFSPPGQNTAGVVEERDLKIIKSVPGISRAAGRLFRSLTVEYKYVAESLIVAGLPHEPDDRDLILEAINVEVAEGRQLKSADRGKILVGYDLWAKEYFPKRVRIGTKLNVQGKDFKVVGLLEKIGTGRDAIILINDDDLRELIDEKEELSAIIAQVSTGEEPSKIADRVLRTMRRDRNQKEGFEDITVQTSEELIASINVILGVVQAVFVGIALISLFVGGIGIMNTMYTAVLERTADIGIMKAIGARNSDVLMIFLLESGLLGLAGGLIGVGLGIGLSMLVEFAAKEVIGDLVKAYFPLYLILGALAFSFIIGVISGMFPARQASKLQPVEALRNG